MTARLMTRLQTAEQGYVIEHQGLMLTKASMSEAEWVTIGEQLSHRHDSTTWAVADWLIEGGRTDRNWLGGSTYSRAVAITGLSAQHLSNLYRTGMAFPRSERLPLSFSAHRELLRVPRELRKPYSDIAVKKQWSADKINNYINKKIEEARLKVERETRQSLSSKTEIASLPTKRLSSTYYRGPEVRCPKCSHTFEIKGHKVNDEDHK